MKSITAYFLFTILTVWVNIANTTADSGILIPNTSNEVEKHIKCLIDFTFKYKDLVVYKDSDIGNAENDMLDSLIQYNEQNRNLVVETVTSDQQCTNSKNFCFKQYLIFANTAKALKIIIQKCLYKKLRASFPLFFIVAYNTTETAEILEVLKFERIYLSPLVTAYNETGLLLHAIKPGCKGDTEVHSDLYRCLKTVLHSEFPLFNHKHCNFKVGVRIVPPYVIKLPTEKAEGFHNKFQGTELLILRYLMNYLNHKIQIIAYNSSTSVGHYNDETKTGSGLIKDLTEGKIDIIIGAITYTNDSRPIEPFYKSAYENRIAIVKKRKDNEFMKMFNVFSWEVWLFTSVLLLTLYCFPHIVANYYNIPNLTNMVSFKLFTILLGKSINFRRKHFKLLFLSWIWFTFLFRSCYEAKITSLFIDRDSSKQIDSLNEICEKKYTIFIDKRHASMYKDTMEFPDCKFSFDQFVLVENPLHELLDSKLDSVAVFMYEKQFMWELQKNLTTIVENLHIIKELLGVRLFYFYSRSGEILSSSFLHRSARRNIDQNFLLTYVRYIENTADIIKNKDRNLGEKSPLTLWQLRSIFILYIICVIICILCFFFEIVMDKTKLRKKSQ